MPPPRRSASSTVRSPTEGRVLVTAPRELVVVMNEGVELRAAPAGLVSASGADVAPLAQMLRGEKAAEFMRNKVPGVYIPDEVIARLHGAPKGKQREEGKRICVEIIQQVRQIAAEILAAHCGMESQALVDLFAGEAGYATPKIDVRGSVIHDEKILLVRELLDQVRWTLPGGWADLTDSPAEAVTREIAEEAGYFTRAVKLAAVYDRNRRGHP